MIDEESYSALYLYNAVIEYIYFLIILIQDRGPNHLDNVSKHVRFFKRDVYAFIQTFNGEDFDQKVGHMLHTATSAFEVQDNVVHLTKNCSQFKEVIYEDFLVSKVVDLILRGISRVQDICQNLNLNSIIFIKENDLIEMIKHYPYFHFNCSQSVVLLQYHGLIGFERHIYGTTVNYFQSYFQNVSKLTYGNIKLHSSCIPCCAIKNSLIVFCLLHASPYFKCRSGKISLRSRSKRKCNVEQVVDVEKLQSKGFLSIGVLVHEALGPVISCWKGEISRLHNSAGLIQSVVSFKNGQHGVFFVYFYKTALKHCSEIGDLEQFLKHRAVVEFDAEFCGAIMSGQAFWEATRLKVADITVKQSKYENSVDVEEYMTNVNANNFNMRPVLKACTVANCGVEYTAFEEMPVNKGSLAVQNRKENVCEEFLTLVPESDNDNSNEKITSEIELDSWNCDASATFSETKSSDRQNLLRSNSGDLVKSDIQNISNKCTEENTMQDVVNVPDGIINSKNSSDINSSPNLPAKVPSKSLDHDKSLDTVCQNGESKCSITEPKKTKECFEEKELPSHQNEVSILHENKGFNSVFSSDVPKEISNQNLDTIEESQHKCAIEVPKTTKKCFEEKNLPAHSNEALNPHETNNKSFSSVHRSNVPKETSKSKKKLKNAVENKCSIKVPKTTKKCFEENLPAHSNEAPRRHEVKNSFNSVLSSNLPKQNSNKYLDAVKENDISSQPNEDLNALETKNKGFGSIHSSNLPKEILNSNKNLISVSTKEEKKCSIQVPKTTDKCFEEKDLPTHLNKISCPHETVSSYINLAPNGSNNSTFLFGVVTFESTDDGVADSCFENEPCKVLFQKKGLCFQNGAGNVIGRGKTVLLFVPYVDIEDPVLIATFAYPLTPGETIEAEKNGCRAQDFIVNHFSHLMKRSFPDTYTCDCDISKSLLMSTQLRPNFSNDKKSSASEAIQILSEDFKMSAKTYERLCSLANQICVRSKDETCKKLFSILRFSIAKHTPSKFRSPFWLRNISPSRSFKLNSKKDTLDGYCSDDTQSIAFKEKTVAVNDYSGNSGDNTQSLAFDKKTLAVNDYSGDGSDNTRSMAFEENNQPKILLKPSSVEKNCAFDDNRNIVDLKTLNNDRSRDQNMAKEDHLKVSRGSCSSVSSFSSCLEYLSDDVFYSCDSEFDSSPSSPDECPEKNQPLCENELSSSFKECPKKNKPLCENELSSSSKKSPEKNKPLCENKLSNSSKESPEKNKPLCENELSSSSKETPEKNKPLCENELSVNVTDFKSSMSISLDKIFKVKTQQKVETKFRYPEDKNFYLKLRRSSLLKHKKRSKVIFPVNNNYCKSCHKPSMTVAAEIIMVKKSCIYFELISEEDNAIFAFPKSLIPVEMHKRIKLNKTITVILDPHPLLSLSQVMQVFF